MSSAPGRPVTPLQTGGTDDEFKIPDMAEVAAAAALAGVRSGSSVQIVRRVLAAGGPFIAAAQLREQADVVDTNAAELDSLTEDDRQTYRSVARLLRDRAFDLEQRQQ